VAIPGYAYFTFYKQSKHRYSKKEKKEEKYFPFEV
jgi:hypothetical protein